MQSTVIPLGLSTKIFLPENRGAEKAVLFFLSLKSLEFRDNGFIKNYRSRIREIGKQLDCSEATVRRRIGELKAIGLISFHGKSIAIRSYKRLCDVFGIKYTRRFYIDFQEFIKNPRAILEYMALNTNINQQNHVVKKKVISVFGNRQRRNNSTGRIAAERIRESSELMGYSVLDAIEQINLGVRTESSFSTILNNDQTQAIKSIKSKSAMSCLGMAKLIGKQSGSTGSKRLKRMVDLNMIERRYRYEIMYCGPNASGALSYLRETITKKVFLKRGHYVISPIACSISFRDDYEIRFVSCKVNTVFDVKQ
jgi:predicted transcriptional regulator